MTLTTTRVQHRFSGATQITYKLVLNLGIASYQGTTLVVPPSRFFLDLPRGPHARPRGSDN
jgi:hypothetical protein